MELNWKLILIQLANFLIFFLILLKLLYQPVKKMIQERKDKIQSDLDYAKRANEEAKTLLEQQKVLLKETQEKTESVIKTAIDRGKENAELIMKEAKEHSAALLNNARKDIEDWKKKTIVEIEKIIWDTSLDLSKKIIRQQLEDEKLKKDLNDEVVSLLEERLRLKNDSNN